MTRQATWPGEIPDILTAIGLDAKAMEPKAKDNEEKYLAIVEDNQKWCHASGHGGVPNAVFRGEPFWGQDRIGQLIWRLTINGLTERQRVPVKGIVTLARMPREKCTASPCCTLQQSRHPTCP